MYIKLGLYEKEYREQLEEFLKQLGISYTIKQYESNELELKIMREKKKMIYEQDPEKVKKDMKKRRQARKENPTPIKPQQLAEYRKSIGEKYGDYELIDFYRRDPYYIVYYVCRCIKCGKLSIRGRAYMRKDINNNCICHNQSMSNEEIQESNKLIGKIIGDFRIEEYLGNDFYRCVCTKCGKVKKITKKLLEKETLKCTCKEKI